MVVLTAYVRGTDGHRYSIFFTLFKRAGFVLPVSQVVDLDTGEIVDHTEQLEPATIGSTHLDFLSQHANLRYDAAHGTWYAGVGGKDYELALEARPAKPYVLHGGGSGSVPQGSATSRYYSSTRMRTTGTVRPRGGKRVSFSGTAWFDHQWGNFANVPSASHWDWFSCRFDDRTELMLYRFRDGHMNGTAVDSAGRGRLVTAFTAKPRRAGVACSGPHVASRLEAGRSGKAPHRASARHRPQPALPQYVAAHVLGGRRHGDRDEDGDMLR